jgi:hypothetical protein
MSFRLEKLEAGKPREVGYLECSLASGSYSQVRSALPDRQIFSKRQVNPGHHSMEADVKWRNRSVVTMLK